MWGGIRNNYSVKFKQILKQMRKVFLMVVLLNILSGCGDSTKKSEGSAHSHPETSASDGKVKSKSPKKEAMATIGGNHIHVVYSSPGVRGRLIFGGLVGYDEVWSTGAHQATSVDFQQAVVINETTVPAGKYGFFTIPGKEEWTVIFSKDWDMHLADDYKKDNDVIRFSVVPKKLNEPVESLTYDVKEKSGGTGHFSVSWADVEIAFDLKNAE